MEKKSGKKRTLDERINYGHSVNADLLSADLYSSSTTEICSLHSSPNAAKRQTASDGKNKLSSHPSHSQEVEFEDPFEDEVSEEDLEGFTISEEEEEEEKEKDEANGNTVNSVQQTNDLSTFTKAWVAGRDALKEGECLEYDSSSYEMLHRGTLDWSCLSFDVIADNLGPRRSMYPHTAFVVAGTQADKESSNRVFVMKWSQLHSTTNDGVEKDSDSDDDDDDNSNDDSDREETALQDPVLDFKVFNHPGTVNRVRVCPQAPRLVATWSSNGTVYIWDANLHLSKLGFYPSRMAEASSSSSLLVADSPRPESKAEFTNHTSDGFALDWSPHDIGRLLTGGSDGRICLHEPIEGGWSMSQSWHESLTDRGGGQGEREKRDGGSRRNGRREREGVGSEVREAKEERKTKQKAEECGLLLRTSSAASIEDVKWKVHQNSPHVFAACGVDKSIRLFDVRSGFHSTLQIMDSHDSDVNVISWNPIQEDLLLSGGDDGFCKIWDMRFTEMPVVKLHWHKQPITSVDWHPTDEATFASSSADDSVTLWDVSVEPEEVAEGEQEEEDTSETADSKKWKSPDQLMFQHMGQSEITEIKWHPQIPGVLISTAVDGFNILKTCNI